MAFEFPLEAILVSRMLVTNQMLSCMKLEPVEGGAVRLRLSLISSRS